MIIDPIADLLTRIRNGYTARLTEVSIPFSRIKSDILKVLKKNNYILSHEEAELSP
jgi:small subunit ribosomal protein S8